MTCAFALAALAGCGGSTAATSISIARGTATVTAGRTLQLGLIATSAVTWSVDEGAAGGSVDSTGLYTAPATPGTWHVSATLQSDAAKKATAAVTVVAAAGVPAIALTATIAAPGEAGLTASVTAVAGMTYTWRVLGGGAITAGAGTHAITFNAGDTGELVVGCTLTNAAGDSGAEGLAVVTIAVAAVPAPDAPVILGAPSPVSAGALGLTAHVENPDAALTYAWSIDNGGEITGGADAEAVTFNASLAPATLTLSVSATNASGTSPAAAVQIEVIARPSMPLIRAPVRVTAGRPGLLAWVPTLDGAFTHVWTVSGATVTAPQATVLQSDQIIFTAGGGETITLSVVESNLAGDSAPAATATVLVSPPGVELVAGALGGRGNSDGLRGEARFDQPRGVAVGSDGNTYVTDYANNLIRRIAPDGAVTTLAGSGSQADLDGIGSGASFFVPWGIAADSDGGLFVSEPYTFTIRRVDTATGAVTTPIVAGYGDQDGPAVGPVGPPAALFGSINFLTVDPGGDLFASDLSFGRVRRLHDEGGGRWSSSRYFSFPNGSSASLAGLVSDSDGGFFIDDSNHAVDHLYPGDGVQRQLVAGDGGPGFADGTPDVSKLSTPQGLARDPVTGTLYVGDEGNAAIRAIAPDGGTWVTSTLRQDLAHLAHTEGVAFDSHTGSVFAAEPDDDSVVQVSADGGIAAIYGNPAHTDFVDGVGAAARFGFSAALNDSVTSMAGVAVDPASGTIYVADPFNNNIRALAVDASGVGTVSTLAGNGADQMPDSGFGSNGGYRDGLLVDAQLSQPGGVAFDPVAGPTGTQATLWIADTGNNVIRAVTWDQSVNALVLITPAGNIHQSCQDGGIGDGSGPQATFCNPQGIAVDQTTGTVFVADTGANIIRMMQPAASGDGSYTVTTIAGASGDFCGFRDGSGVEAEFCQPTSIAVADSRTLFVADTRNNAVRMLALGSDGQWVASTIGSHQRPCVPSDGADGEIQLCNPSSVAVDAQGNVYVGERGYGTPQTGSIRKLVQSGTSWTSSTIVGVPGKRGVKLGAFPAGVNQPAGLAVDAVGDLLVSDFAENAVLRVRVPGLVAGSRKQ